MEDENKRQILQAMTRLMLQFCRDGVASITIHADMVDGTPFVSAIAWGEDIEDKRPLWDWADFPEEGEDE